MTKGNKDGTNPGWQPRDIVKTNVVSPFKGRPSPACEICDGKGTINTLAGTTETCPRCGGSGKG